MKTFFSSLVLLLLTTTLAPAQDSKVKSVLDRYADFRPAAKDLGMYRLDWAASLAAAQERALLENRPVCLVVIHARYGDITSGHC